MFKVMAEFRQALTAAQVRTGDSELSVNVKAGSFQVCRVRYDTAGKSTVEPITGYLTKDDALSHLKNMGI
jgi:ribosome-interacting GTPase 1